MECASRRPSRMRQLLLHTLVADATDTESDYLLASLLGATDSIDVLKPDGARPILKKRPGEIVRDLKRRVAAGSRTFRSRSPRRPRERRCRRQAGRCLQILGLQHRLLHCATIGRRVPARPVGAEVVLELILRMSRSAMFATVVPSSPSLLVRGGLRSVAAGRVLVRGEHSRDVHDAQGPSEAQSERPPRRGRYLGGLYHLCAQEVSFQNNTLRGA